MTIQRITATTMKFTGYLGVSGVFDTYTQVTNRGVDGLGNSVYAGLSKGGWPAVFVVRPDGVMLASSINDRSCKTLDDAKAKADYAVEKKLTRYWDSGNPLERYYLSSPSREPRLVKTTAAAALHLADLTRQRAHMSIQIQARIKDQATHPAT